MFYIGLEEIQINVVINFCKTVQAENVREIYANVREIVIKNNIVRKRDQATWKCYFYI